MSIKIALAGNPNSGKTTLFNVLTGANQFVGNWPGVTVEKKEGKVKGYEDVVITDLPGVYSLSPYTLEEIVARNYLLNEKPDVIINIIDGTNIERNLYLTTQLMELGIPVVLAVNLMDAVKKSGDVIDVDKMGETLSCEAVYISALKGDGVDTLIEKTVAVAAQSRKTGINYRFSNSVENAIAQVIDLLDDSISEEQKRFFAIKLLEKDENVTASMKISSVDNIIESLEKECDDDVESIIANERYTYVTSVIDRFVTKNKNKTTSVSDKIDRVVTNRIAAIPIFAAVMFLVYYVAVTTVGTWVTDFTNDGLFGEGFYLFGNKNIWVDGIPVIVERGLTAINCAPWLQSLVLDGIVAGVGAVLGFVPQMLVLFFILGFLESCGYMSRIAFIMDKIFHKFGLSGKSFIPMLVGAGCGVPGIMASRTIENDRDRKITIITTTFIPCGAKLPIIALVASALFNGAWWLAPVAYFIGIAAVIVSGIILKKTKLFASEPSPFVMELPAYRLPTMGNLLRGMWERGWSFIKKAGTVILLSTIVIWAGSCFGMVDGRFGFSLDMELDNSLLGIIGNAVKFVFAPLGFDNAESVIATVMGLVAKEEVVAVLGILDFAGMTKLAAFAFMIFNLLCAPCFAAMGAIKREMNNPKWFWFAIGYQCGFAYVISLIVYQLVGLVIGEVMFGVGTVVALAVLGFMLYMLFRPQPKFAKK